VVYSIYIDLKIDLKRGNRYKHGFVFTYAPSTFVICNNLCCHPIDVMFCIYLNHKTIHVSYHLIHLVEDLR
jgi:hypothetical protein